MCILNGLDAGQELKKLLPQIELIILTMNEDPEVASKALNHSDNRVIVSKNAQVRLARQSQKSCVGAPT